MGRVPNPRICTFGELIGKNVKRLYKEKQLTRTAVSRLTDINATRLRALEQGNSNATITVMDRVARAFGVQPSELLKQ